MEEKENIEIYRFSTKEMETFKFFFKKVVQPRIEEEITQAVKKEIDKFIEARLKGYPYFYSGKEGTFVI